MIYIKNNTINWLLIPYLVSISIAQTNLNYYPLKNLLIEKSNLLNTDLSSSNKLNQNSFQITYNQYFHINTNLPNFENHNGFYFPKGSGSITSLLFQYKGKYFFLSAEPQQINLKESNNMIPTKSSLYGVLNDVQLNNIVNDISPQFRNTGFAINYYDLGFGYGNWDQWWGPGIHNSLVMSNNAVGIPHYFFGTLQYKPIINDLEYYLKYMISDAMVNNAGEEYFLSAYYFSLRYRNIQLGMSKHILNGGYNDLDWSLNDAFAVLFTKNNNKYWDEITDYFISASFPSSGLKVFLEVGFPNRTYANKDPGIYGDNAISSNLGLRKYGAFGKKELMFGFEYTRLVQGIFYNIIPTPNWYDNIKYNYSSYRGRRWAAHSGSDSDDFLVFIGYMDDRVSIVYGLNYERHGVTYHFPPEVKFEQRISVGFKYKNTFIYCNYENEYFEHYGFVDVNKNVWEETFEPGSIQRTKTFLISLEHTLSF